MAELSNSTIVTALKRTGGLGNYKSSTWGWRSERHNILEIFNEQSKYSIIHERLVGKLKIQLLYENAWNINLHDKSLRVPPLPFNMKYPLERPADVVISAMFNTYTLQKNVSS